MKTKTIEKILNFLKEKEGKELPNKWFDSIEKLKLIKELETHADGIQYRYKGDLLLSNSNITKLPNDLYVYGRLVLDNCKQLMELPTKLRVEGRLSLFRCKQLTKLPDNLYVGIKLALQKTNIEEIPDNLYVRDDLYINGTPLSNKYSNYEIREMITSKGGTLIGKIYR